MAPSKWEWVIVIIAVLAVLMTSCKARVSYSSEPSTPKVEKVQSTEVEGIEIRVFNTPAGRYQRMIDYELGVVCYATMREQSMDCIGLHEPPERL